ncbi:MAG: sel1 repeat family protein [Ignavibacteriae bacterium]|nr:sel1 repeat family protein [Ignavibacteriota bacterium]
MISSGRMFCVLICSTLSLALTSSLHAQSRRDSVRNPNSPVFKNYRPPVTAPLLEQSDATYQMWQGFRVLQEANAGDPVSQFELSIRYLTGRGFKADTVKAAYWTESAANKNHLLARYNLAIFQLNGWGTGWNPFEAFRNFHIIAEKNIREGQYILAQLYLENLIVPKNTGEAYRWMKLAADSGYAPARESLKDFERRGFGSGSSASTALSSIDTSASQRGTIQLQFLTFNDDTIKTPADSVLVEDGLKAGALSGSGQLQSAFESVVRASGKVFTDTVGLGALHFAAELGSAEALTLLGRQYERGPAGVQDAVRAAYYYVRAIRLDSPRAARLLIEVLQQKEFFTKLKARVGAGQPEALVTWSGLVALGFDRQLTDAQALQMLERAAAQNFPQALIELGICYNTARWVRQNTKKAEELWRRAASIGSREAEVRLAIASVRGSKKNPGAAVGVLADAAKSGSVLAEFALAYCFETGAGVQRSWGEAARLYRSSAQRGSQDAYRALERMYDILRPKEKEFRIVE